MGKTFFSADRFHSVALLNFIPGLLHLKSVSATVQNTLTMHKYFTQPPQMVGLGGPCWGWWLYNCVFTTLQKDRVSEHGMCVLLLLHYLYSAYTRSIIIKDMKKIHFLPYVTLICICYLLTLVKAFAAKTCWPAHTKLLFLKSSRSLFITSGIKTNSEDLLWVSCTSHFPRWPMSIFKIFHTRRRWRALKAAK